MTNTTRLLPITIDGEAYVMPLWSADAREPAPDVVYDLPPGELDSPLPAKWLPIDCDDGVTRHLPLWK